MGTLWPKNWKKLSFLLVTVSSHRIKCNTSTESFFASFLLPTVMSYEQYMRTLWPKAWKFDDLTVLCAVWFTLQETYLWNHELVNIMLTFKVNVKVKLESFNSCLQSSILVIIIIIKRFRFFGIFYYFSNFGDGTIPLLAKISETANFQSPNFTHM